MDGERKHCLKAVVDCLPGVSRAIAKAMMPLVRHLSPSVTQHSAAKGI
jgi:hypothetical protein